MPVGRSLRTLGSLGALFGFDPMRGYHAMSALRGFLVDLRELRRQSQRSSRPMPFGRLYPCLEDKYDSSGVASGHYFHQDLLVARRIFVSQPETHIDVGSRVDGFVAHVASYRQVSVIDIRHLDSKVENIRFVQADLMRPLPEHLLAASDSVSCLHTLEHFGLGRYGDPLSFDGYLMGLANLFALAKDGGMVYVSVPIGAERIEFNAHRVFSVLGFSGILSRHGLIERFSYVDDAGDLHEDVSTASSDAEVDFNCRFGCGIWECRKFARSS